jgi:hypothetical protein
MPGFMNDWRFNFPSHMHLSGDGPLNRGMDLDFAHAVVCKYMELLENGEREFILFI